MPRNSNAGHPSHSATRQKGLRNRYRNGRGTYSVKGKRRTADRYGTYVNGVLISGH